MPSQERSRNEVRNARLYVGVVICEVLVIGALWMVGRIYG